MLDVHLGTLAHRLRVLGIDAAYRNDAGDDALIEQANRQHRILLTQDRGLLRRWALWAGAHVRGTRSADQLADVLDRFAPPLAPFTRCTGCNGELEQVPRTWPTNSSPALSATTTATRGVGRVDRCTGTGLTGVGSTRSWTWRVAPTLMPVRADHPGPHRSAGEDLRRGVDRAAYPGGVDVEVGHRTHDVRSEGAHPHPVLGLQPRAEPAGVR